MANPAPGFKTRPDHEITLSPGRAAVVRYIGKVVAQTDEAVLLRESRYPARAYLPRTAVTATLHPAPRTTHCPFKGDTVYFDLEIDGERIAEAAWSYEAPFDEMVAITDLVSFDDRFAVEFAQP